MSIYQCHFYSVTFQVSKGLVSLEIWYGMIKRCSAFNIHYYFKYCFRVEHKRLKTRPIFGEHVTPVCQTTPQMQFMGHDTASNR